MKIRGRITKWPRVEAYLRRKGRSADEVLASADANQSIPTNMKLEYSTNSNVETQQCETSPLGLTTPSSATTRSDPSSDQPTRLPTPVSFPGTPDKQHPLAELPGQPDLPACNLQGSWDRLSVAHRSEAASADLARLDMPTSSMDLSEGGTESHVWSQLDNVQSFNNVVNQILRPDCVAASTPSQLYVFRILSGRHVASQEELIRGLHRENRVSEDETGHGNGHHNVADLSQSFLECFLSWCSLHTQGFLEAARDPFREANGLLEDMISNCHPECLTTLHLMLSVLEAQGQKDLAAVFLSNVLVFSQSNRLNNPVAATTEFMVSIATRKLRVVERDVGDLQSVYEQLKDWFGVESPSALVGLYHVAWRSAKAEEHRERAMQILEGLIPSSITILGPSHFFTITCMTLMARVSYYVRTVQRSILLMREAIEMIDFRYAEFHPYRLEALHRLAIFLMDEQDWKEAETVLQEVIAQRDSIFGPANSLTIRSRELHDEVLAEIRNLPPEAQPCTKISSYLRA